MDTRVHKQRESNVTAGGHVYPITGQRLAIFHGHVASDWLQKQRGLLAFGDHHDRRGGGGSKPKNSIAFVVFAEKSSVPCSVDVTDRGHPLFGGSLVSPSLVGSKHGTGLWKSRPASRCAP